MSIEWEPTPCLERGCSRCCRETEMPLAEKDIARLEALGEQRESFSIVLPDGSVRLQNDPATRACVFLDTDSADLDAPGTCRVWDDRPEGCRIYPLVLDQLDQPFLDELCPHRDEFPTPPLGIRRRLVVLDDTVRAEARSRQNE